MNRPSRAYAVTMIYNEVDIITDLIENCLRQEFNGLIVLDHFSNDGTEKILEKYRRKLLQTHPGFDYFVVYTKERAFNKVRKINGLAAMAHVRAWWSNDRDGDTWVVPMDADEEWTTNTGEPLAVRLRREEEQFCFYQHMRNFILTPKGFKDYYLCSNDRRQQIRNEKCCFIYRQYRWATSGFHNILERGEFDGERGRQVRVPRATWLEVNHYPYRGLEQVRKKYQNLLTAIVSQKNRDPAADKHSVERGSYSEGEFAEFFYHNCYVEEPEHDRQLVKR